MQYLGLPSHPLHELASRYLWLVDAEHDELYGKPVNRYGHLLSFCVRGGPERPRTMFDRLQRIWRATDLGRIKSVATIPAISTHQQQGEKGPPAGPHPAEHGPPLRRRRASGRRDRRFGPGAGREVVLSFLPLPRGRSHARISLSQPDRSVTFQGDRNGR